MNEENLIIETLKLAQYYAPGELAEFPEKVQRAIDLAERNAMLLNIILHIAQGQRNENRKLRDALEMASSWIGELILVHSEPESQSRAYVLNSIKDTLSTANEGDE